MEGIKVVVDEKTGIVTITGKIGADGGPYASQSGKSVLLLNSGGTRLIEGVMYKGRTVSLNLSLTVRHPDAPEPKAKEGKVKDKIDWPK